MKFRFDKSHFGAAGRVHRHPHSLGAGCLSPPAQRRRSSGLVREGKRHAGDSGEEPLFRDGEPRTGRDGCSRFSGIRGIALNLTNGGLNKHAVKMALKLGAKKGVDAHGAFLAIAQEQ